MEYDHSRKAGNIGDVWKHFALARVFDSIDKSRVKSYIETHAGWGIYGLEDKPRHREWRKGIGKVICDKRFLNEPFIAKVLQRVNPNLEFPGHYSGSACVAQTLLRPSEIILFELCTEAVKSLEKNIIGANVRTEDGFRGIDSWNSGRSVSASSIIFADPPYTNKSDWKKVRLLIQKVRSLPSQVTLIIWYPIFAYSEPDKLKEELSEVQRPAWMIECVVDKPRAKPSQKFKGSGLIAINLHNLELFKCLCLLARDLAIGMALKDEEPEIRQYYWGI